MVGMDLDGTHVRIHQQDVASKLASNAARNDFATLEPSRRNGEAVLKPSHDLAPRKSYDQAAVIEDDRLCETPRSQTPASSVSDPSMHNHVENVTPSPPATPAGGESPSRVSAAQIGRLSLDNNDSDPRKRSSRGRGPVVLSPRSASKRAASSELPRHPSKYSAAAQPSSRFQPEVQHQRGTARPRGGRGNHPKQNTARKRFGPHRDILAKPIVPRDSGYESNHPSRTSTLQQQHDVPPVAIDSLPHQTLEKLDEAEVSDSQLARGDVVPKPKPTHSKYELILQPDSSPISQDQLAAEVKGIYAGLVMVEAKCINIDAAQAADPCSTLEPEQWQALIALHRTLLYEHHDFLMATQHPSATIALRGLAAKYSMPARMWRHGIHAFLEVLRHRRPDSQDYMLAFIYLAYQMMALLLETVPTFTDTWIECLGDLARYRMAIEDEKEAHAIWGGVAARWYNTASDRHPAIGRLYHHLGILEFASLKKMFLYVKAETCVIPFANARDSLATLCGPITQEALAPSKSVHSAEASLVTFHALMFSASEQETTSKSASLALSQLERLPASKIKTLGVPLIVTNVAAMLEYGSTTNTLRQLFDKANYDSTQSTRPSTTAAASLNLATDTHDQLPITGTSPSFLLVDFCYKSFNTFIRLPSDSQSLRDILPAVHITLVWLHSLHSLQSRSRVNDDLAYHTAGSLMNSERFSWGGLCGFMNVLIQHDPIDARTMECARHGTFLGPEKNKISKPLTEDFLIRGLVWTQFYFPSGWFDNQSEEEGRESPDMHKARVARVQWLVLHLAFRTDYIKYDVHSKTFRAPVAGPPVLAAPVEVKPSKFKPQQSVEPPTPTSRSSTTLAAHSDSDGFNIVEPRRSRPARTWADVAAKPRKPEKHSQDYSDVRVVDDDDGRMQWQP